MGEETWKECIDFTIQTVRSKIGDLCDHCEVLTLGEDSVHSIDCRNYRSAAVSNWCIRCEWCGVPCNKLDRPDGKSFCDVGCVENYYANGGS